MQPSSVSAQPTNQLEVLERIEAKLDRLERVLRPLAMLGELPAVAGTALETLDDQARGHEPDLDERLRGVVTLLERLSRPDTLARLHEAVDLADSLPGLVATTIDTVDAAAGSPGLDLHGRMEAAMALLGQLTRPDALQVMGRLVDVLRRAQAQGERRVTAWGLLKALRDANAQRAMGLLVGVLEGLGQALARHDRKSLTA